MNDAQLGIWGRCWPTVYNADQDPHVPWRRSGFTGQLVPLPPASRCCSPSKEAGLAQTWLLSPELSSWLHPLHIWGRNGEYSLCILFLVVRNGNFLSRFSYDRTSMSHS